MIKTSERKLRLALQLFAEGDAGAAGSDPVPAEGNDDGAATAQGKETKGAGAPSNDEKKYSDKDLDEILNKRFARWQKEQDKAVKEAAAEAEKLATMNATQKAEYERDQLKEQIAEQTKQLDEYKRKDVLAEMTKTARKMLSDDGISVPDELLSALVTTDAEKTKATVDGFKAAYKEAVENAVKERLRGEVPKTGTASASPVTEIEKRIKKYS